MKSCNQCGKCCILYSDGGLTATEDEIERWQETNPEIYRYVNNGSIWMDPDTGEQLKYCPWLKKESNKTKYYCSIYLERPDDCRHYPVTITEMIRDECEMIEAVDLLKPKMAQRKLDQLMADSRPAVND
jgi:uncharacterized protein